MKRKHHTGNQEPADSVCRKKRKLTAWQLFQTQYSKTEGIKVIKPLIPFNVMGAAGKNANTNFAKQSKQCYEALSAENKEELRRQSEEGSHTFHQMSEKTVTKTVSGITKSLNTWLIIVFVLECLLS